MSSQLLLAPTDHPRVPEDEVLLTVRVDKTTCGLPNDRDFVKRLEGLESSGMLTPISRIVAYSSLQYRGAVRDCWGIGENRAMIQNAWQEICNWNPHLSTDARGMPRLVVDGMQNARRQANFTEVMGVGVGLLVATRLYEMPFRFWRPTPGNTPFDFRAPASGGSELQLEARGRFKGNFGTAKQQVRKKFGQNATLARQLGVIYAPRTSANAAYPDITLLDPENDGSPDITLHRNYRALLQHYATFFDCQDFPEFATRLRRLANCSDVELEHYLNYGDDELQNAQIKTVPFQIEDEEFFGQMWPGTPWPRSLGSALGPVNFHSGLFICGLWVGVVDALVNGDLDEIETMKVNEAMYVSGDQIYILLEDATVLSWRPFR